MQTAGLSFRRFRHRTVSWDSDALDKRQKKILAYIDEADSKISALEANIGFINADLMVLLVYYRQDLDQVRSAIMDANERLQLLYPISEQVYKICKQIDSFIRTAMRLERDRGRRIAKAKKQLLPSSAELADSTSQRDAAGSATSDGREHDHPLKKSEEIES